MNTTNHSNPFDNSEQFREIILGFIKSKNLIHREGNLIRSEKVFTINAFLQWCLGNNQKRKFSATQWSKTEKIIGQYIAGIIDLQWVDNGFKTIEIKKNDDRKKRTRRKQ